MNSIKHCLEFAESARKVKERAFGERVIRVKSGRGDYGVTDEPYAVNSKFMPPPTYAFPRDNSIGLRKD